MRGPDSGYTESVDSLDDEEAAMKQFKLTAAQYDALAREEADKLGKDIEARERMEFLQYMARQAAYREALVKIENGEG